ncbi:MAG: ChbG/HpnK family deacetylase [Deltaproteobacteria bacterium]|nr:ChbG/HpnK family deacetylase [Deltaproteobacteria bacterium]MBI4796850.1 ChbG/HpnK family deacetylase [Deltaproteobacteria bacterium]
MRLIINADDLGRNTQVNAVIFDLIDRRLVTSATIMANGPALEECLVRIPAYPSCSFGIHLNITEFQPLTSSAPLAELLDPRGNFSLANYRKARLGQALRKDIFLEWSAQVQRLCSYGQKVSHLDSHHDVHTDPRLFFMLKRLQRVFGIRKARIAPNISLDPKITFRKNRLWNLALRHLYATTTTSGFTDFATFLQAPEEIARRHPTMELMVHPGSPRFAAETGALQTPWLAGLPFAVRLISYCEL